MLVFGLLVAGLFGAEVLRDFTPAKSAVFFFLVAWFPLTALHEAGHAWMARVFGWRVFEVVVGFGRVVKRWQRGATRIELRAFPIGGYVVPVPRSREGAKLASFFIYAAGPGIEILLVVVLGLILGFDTLTSPSTSVGIIAAQAVSAAALTGAITNLLPMTTPEGGWTDGRGMLMSPFLDDEHFARQMASPYLIEGQRRLQGGAAAPALDVFESGLERYPSVVMLHLGRAQALIALERRYPGYGFAAHKGYPTAAHLQALRTLGVSPVHRRSFAPVKKLLGQT